MFCWRVWLSFSYCYVIESLFIGVIFGEGGDNVEEVSQIFFGIRQEYLVESLEAKVQSRENLFFLESVYIKLKLVQSCFLLDGKIVNIIIFMKR